jgi:hypothetical protein
MARNSTLGIPVLVSSLWLALLACGAEDSDGEADPPIYQTVPCPAAEPTVGAKCTSLMDCEYGDAVRPECRARFGCAETTDWRWKRRRTAPRPRPGSAQTPGLRGRPARLLFHGQLVSMGTPCASVPAILRSKGMATAHRGSGPASTPPRRRAAPPSRRTTGLRAWSRVWNAIMVTSAIGVTAGSVTRAFGLRVAMEAWRAPYKAMRPRLTPSP